MFIDEKAIKNFSEKVRNLVARGKCNHIDAILEISYEMGLEPEAAGKLLDEDLVKKIKQEGKELNLLKTRKKKKT